jgi:hypothetical protein
MAGLARLVEPEWLDELPADDPRTQGSRRDLARINAVMFQAAIMARALARSCGAPKRIVDLGSGDGRFMLGVARRLAKRWPGVTVVLLDKQNIVSADTRAGFAGLGWRAEPVSADVFDYLGAGGARADAVCANLFLHHFEDGALRRLLAAAALGADAFVACEPRRAPTALIASKLVIALGCNAVTRHDAVASVRAGFRDAELSALWPDRDAWHMREAWAPPFSHVFAARRRDV